MVEVTDRSAKLGNVLSSLEDSTVWLCQEFADFSGGMRMLILLRRKKDGGHNKEEQRMIETCFTFDEDSFRRGVRRMLWLMKLHEDTRLYLSVNPRNLKKIVRNIEEDLLVCHYADEEQRDNIYRKLIKAPRHWVMQPSSKENNLFILDVDNVDGKDIHGEALKVCEEKGIEIIKSYQTKNGWHIITKPFNPALFTLGEVKKDGMILLAY